MPSIVIAAHNEEAVIEACIDALERQVDDGTEIVVSANGCTDRTAEIARARGAIVVDRPEPGKAGALNAGDEAASSFPRIYLDADIVVPDGAIDRLTSVLRSTARLAAVPRRLFDTRGCGWPVRAYFAINERLPVFRSGLFGRGMIVLSQEGRARFARFPELIADDFFVDSQFSDDERVIVDDVEIVVAAPRTTRELLRRLVRVRRGNEQMRAAGGASGLGPYVRRVAKWSWLTDVVLRDPRLIPAALPYVSITLVAALLARRGDAGAWGRDESTRTPRPADDGSRLDT
jgi:glycosyltransferase involved in cell wall biosynthesis